MKLQLLSDLHLESHPHFEVTPAPGADLLVLAGDIGSYQAGSRLGDTLYGLERFSPRRGWPVPVLYVPGNHEYDNDDFDTVHLRLREACEQLDIHWLESETMLIDGVRFVGSSLWTDFDALVDAKEPMTEQLKKRGKAMRAANYYLSTCGTTRRGQPFLAEEVREHGLACQDWLRKALARLGAKWVTATVVPSKGCASADPRYGLTPGTAGFCNSLDELLPLAQLWLHGHLHCAFDYRKDGCRVVANPLGYRSKGEQEGFRPHLLIEVPGS